MEDHPAKLDKSSPVPLYQQLVDEIHRQISSDILKEGDQLMTETDMSEAYNVSRITVRKAFSILTDEGLIIKQQGIGTFVAEKKLTRNISKLMGFTQSCEFDGKTASGKLISADLIVPKLSDAARLGLEEGDRAIRISRIRYADGKSVMLEEVLFSTSYSYLLSEDLCGSIYSILKKHSVVPAHGFTEISICNATDYESQILEVDVGSPLLLLKGYVTDEHGNVIHSSKQIVNSKRYSMKIQF